MEFDKKLKKDFEKFSNDIMKNNKYLKDVTAQEVKAGLKDQYIKHLTKKIMKL